MSKIQISDDLKNAIIEFVKEDVKRDILDSAWPIGSSYISKNPTDPSILFGGTWQRYKGKFLYATTAVNGEIAGSTGNGTGTFTNDHAITVEQMPSHTHTQDWHAHAVHGTTANTNGSSETPLSENWKTRTNDRNGETDWRQPAIHATGGGQGHNHGIPYMSFYVWVRTA